MCVFAVFRWIQVWFTCVIPWWATLALAFMFPSNILLENQFSWILSPLLTFLINLQGAAACVPRCDFALGWCGNSQSVWGRTSHRCDIWIAPWYRIFLRSDHHKWEGGPCSDGHAAQEGCLDSHFVKVDFRQSQPCLNCIFCVTALSLEAATTLLDWLAAARLAPKWK